MNKMICIGDVTIMEDQDGRYRLNDLHKAAGGENKHRPQYWLERPETKEIINELIRENQEKSEADGPASLPIEPIEVIKGGGLQGTYVNEDLVFTYAMWISPKFHLQVSRSFREQKRAELERRQKLTKVEALRENAKLTLELADEIEKHEKLINRVDEGILFEKKRQIEERRKIISIRDIKENYFPGVSEERIYDYLRYVNHERSIKGANESFIDENLMERACDFWNECEKCYSSNVVLLEHKAFRNKVARINREIVDEYWKQI
jgi:hypothetical protein